METEARKKTSPQLIRKVVEFFEYQCVATGDTHDELHHLDENKSNTVFANLVPTRARVNKKLRDLAREAKQSQAVVPPSYLTPKVLLARSVIHGCAWRLGPVYGAARLGGFVARLTGDWHESVKLSCEAIYHARHAVSYELIEDTFQRSIVPALSEIGILPHELRFRICREIGGIYAEHGYNSEALEVYQKIANTKIDSNSEMAALLRRKATTELGLSQETSR